MFLQEARAPEPHDAKLMAPKGGAKADPAAPDTDKIRAFLTPSVVGVLDDADTGPFASEAEYLRTLEALLTLEVQVYKMKLEVQQRVTSSASLEFGDASSSGVQLALHDSIPIVLKWVDRLRKRLDERSRLPLAGTKLKARFVRTCEVYELTPTEQRILAALLMLRTSHAFLGVKIGSSMGYGGGGGMYAGSGAKSGVTIGAILGVSLAEISQFQKPERRHVKQGVVVPGVQLLTELPSLQAEAVLLLVALPLSESQVFNIERPTR